MRSSFLRPVFAAGAAALPLIGASPRFAPAQGAPTVEPGAGHHLPAAATPPGMGRATVVLLVRHAEQAATPADDPAAAVRDCAPMMPG